MDAWTHRVTLLIVGAEKGALAVITFIIPHMINLLYSFMYMKVDALFAFSSYQTTKAFISENELNKSVIVVDPVKF